MTGHGERYERSNHMSTLDDLRWVLGGLDDINSGRRRNIGITRNCAVRLREVIERLEAEGAVARAEKAEAEVERLKRLLTATEAELRYAAGVDDDDPLGGQS